MDKLLMTCIEDQTQNRIPLSTMTIRNKAKFYLPCWKKRLDRLWCWMYCFGWCKQCKKRYLLHNVKVSGEPASDDVKAAE